MSIATIKLDKSMKLGFGVSITGASGVPETRFIIERADGVSFTFNGKQNGSSVEVEILEMKGLIPSGEYKAILEVILENKIYRPLVDTIIFEQPVEVQSKLNVMPEITETVHVDNLITVTPIVNENVLRKTQAATIIAQSLNYVPKENETHQEIIEHAIDSVKVMSEEQIATLKEMLKLAESVGIITST
jgi:hypothetical protein